MAAGRAEEKQGTEAAVLRLPDDEGPREPRKTWRARPRSSPPAETMRTRGTSRSLSPPGYRTRRGHRVSQERGMGYAHGGRRNQSSDASMRSASPPIPQRDAGGRGGRQVQPPPSSHDWVAGEAGGTSHRGQVRETPWNNNPQISRRGAMHQGPPVQNYGATNNIENAGNVVTGTNYGIINMTSATAKSTEEFMLNLSDRLKVSKRAHHQYYAPDDEATLRRGQCTPGTHVNILHGITHWATSDGENVFWLSGPAGTGKTTIACTIAHRVETLLGDGNGKVILGASFFCSRQFPDTRSASSIVPTIVYQLAVRSKSFQNALQEHGKFDTVDHGPRSQIMGLLVIPWKESAPGRLANNEPCYVIPIDALDELEGTGGTEFLGKLFDVVEQQDLSGLKFFVTSRSDPALVKRIESFPDKQVCRLEEVPLEESSADIKLFLSANLAQCATIQQIEQLVSDAAGLFIYAATVVEYVKGRDVEEQTSLLLRLLSNPSSPVRRPSRAATATLDNLYLQVLETSLVDPRERDDPEVFQDCLTILHTFLCTIERTSTLVVVEILNTNSTDGATLLDTGMAKGVLHRLHAVLYTQDGQVMLYHKSFADFLFDQGRSQRFFCDQEQHHRRLAYGCFGVMKQQLRFNIADIPTSYLMDCDNPTLQASIVTNISAPLRYACGNWSAHLTFTNPQIKPSDGLAETLHNFLQLQVLFWMESMNLLCQRRRCQGMLHDAQRWSSKSMDPKGLAGKLADAAALSAYHSTSKAALSTPHLYLSSLATFPRHSILVQNWRQQLGGIPRFVGAHGVGGEAVVACIAVNSSVSSIAVSPDGVNITGATVDGLVRIWDLSTGEEVLVLKGHTDRVIAVSYSPDGTHIASGSWDQSVRVWDVSTGEEVSVLRGHTSKVCAVSFAPDGAHIASGSSDGLIREWDLCAGEEPRVIGGHTGAVYALSYSLDGTHLVSGSFDTSIRMWDLSTGEEVLSLKGHSSMVLALSYSLDATRLASGSADNSIRVWDVSTGKEVFVLKGHTGAVQALSYSPDGTHIVSASWDHSVRVWDLSTGDEARVLRGHTDKVRAVSYLPDGTYVVSGSGDKSIRVWDLSAGEEAAVLKGHTDRVWTVSYSPNGTHLAFNSTENSVRVWDLSTGEEVLVLKGHSEPIRAVSYSPDGTHLVSCSCDNSIRVWDLSTGKAVRILEGHTDWVEQVSYSPDGTHLASASRDESIRVWDLLTGKTLLVLNGHTSRVNTVSYSPDGTHLVSGSYDNSIRVWDLSTGEAVRILEGHASVVEQVSYSPDGTHLASASRDKSVRVWDLSTGGSGATRVLQGHTDCVTAVSYSPDGTHVASGSYDQTIRVWDLSSGEVVNILRGHTNSVKAVSYSPDGTRLTSCSTDKSIRVWDISPDHPPRYVREQGPGGEHTGWALSATDSSAYLMFIRPDALLPDDSNVITLPTTAVPHLDLSNAKLGDRWAECYTPRAL